MPWKDHQTKPMTKAQEVVEFAAWRAGDEEALDRICRSNLRFIRAMVRLYRDYGLDSASLESAALLGMVTAAGKFDPSRGFKFYSYAVHWIKQAIRMELDCNRLVKVPANTSTTIYRLRQKHGTVLAGLREEAQDMTGPTLKAVAIALQAPVFMHSPVEGTTGDVFTRQFANDSLDQMEQEVVRGDIAVSITATLKRLPERSRVIIIRYFGLDGDAPETLEQIGERLGVTRERVRQLKEAAIRKLGGSQSLAHHWHDLEVT